MTGVFYSTGFILSFISRAPCVISESRSAALRWESRGRSLKWLSLSRVYMWTLALISPAPQQILIRNTVSLFYRTGHPWPWQTPTKVITERYAFVPTMAVDGKLNVKPVFLWFTVQSHTNDVPFIYTVTCNAADNTCDFCCVLYYTILDWRLIFLSTNTYKLSLYTV